jgi:hypothetical protein
MADCEYFDDCITRETLKQYNAGVIEPLALKLPCFDPESVVNCSTYKFRKRV